MPDGSALRKYNVTNPVGEIFYHTIEVYHETFRDENNNSKAFRIVHSKDGEELKAFLEPEAILNGGEEVTFIPFPFDHHHAVQEEAKLPTIKLRITNSSKEFFDSLMIAAESYSDIKVTYRDYLKSDLTGPQTNPPIELSFLDLEIDFQTITATAGYKSIAIKRFPIPIYNTKKFPFLTK